MELQKDLMLELRRSKTPQKMLTDFTSSTAVNNATGGFMNSSRAGGFGSPKLKSNSTDFNPVDTNILYIIPPSTCDTAVVVDFVCVCVNPPIEMSFFDDGSNNNNKGIANSGYRSLENQLELHLMPTNLVDNTVAILTKFEQQVQLYF